MTRVAEALPPAVVAKLKTLAEGERCGATGKLVMSRREAKVVARRFRWAGATKAHLCDWCLGYHVTSARGRSHWDAP